MSMFADMLIAAADEIKIDEVPQNKRNPSVVRWFAALVGACCRGPRDAWAPHIKSLYRMVYTYDSG